MRLSHLVSLGHYTDVVQGQPRHPIVCPAIWPFRQTLTSDGVTNPAFKAVIKRERSSVILRAALLVLTASVLIACDGQRSDTGGPDLAPELLSTESAVEPVTERPNILLILVDDMAQSDLGSFGGEIDTPNLDALAMQGMRLANFHASPLCAPSRAMLLSGTDNHIAGVGILPEMGAAVLGATGYAALTENPGYEGYLVEDVVTLPEVLQASGYHTYMAGKWHLGHEENQTPNHRGFEQSFALMEGGAAHLDSMAASRGSGPTYFEDDREVQIPDDFYSTRFYTKKLIDYIEKGRPDGRPFFAYLAYTAPHWPLQAPRDSIDEYRGRYDEGFDVLLERRLKGLQDHGILRVEGHLRSFPRMTGERAWVELSDEAKARAARKMEIYAAMVDDLDDYVGQLVSYLDEIGELENTFIAFMSDNGAESSDLNSLGFMQGWADECCDNELDNIGNAGSYVWLGKNWGRATAAPYRMYKGYASEGGTRTVAFLKAPRQNTGGAISHAYVNIMDMMPTLLAAAGVDVPNKQFRDRSIRPILGQSQLELISRNDGRSMTADRSVGVELHGNVSFRRGKFKILKQEDQLATGNYQLYDLTKDPAELHDLADSMPDVLHELVAGYEQYERDVGVVSWADYVERYARRPHSASKAR